MSRVRVSRARGAEGRRRARWAPTIALLLLTPAVLAGQEGQRPGEGVGADPVVPRARGLLEAGRPAAARELLERRVAGGEAKPRGYLVWHLLGVARLRTGEPEPALAAFERALAKAPRFGPAHVGRARALLRLGRVAEAEAGLLAAGGAEPAPPEVRALRKVAEAEAAGAYWEALAGYRRLEAGLPGLPSLLAGAARVALAMEAHAAAACLVGRALQGTPGDAGLHSLSCTIAVAAREETAAAACLRAVELRPSDASVHLALGRAELDRFRVEESFEAYRRAVELDPAVLDQVPEALREALAHESWGSIAPGLEAWATATSQPASQRAMALDLLAEGALGKGDPALAVSYLERLAGMVRREEVDAPTPGQVGTDPARVHYRLGQAYLQLGNEERGHASMAEFERLEAAAAIEWERQNASFRRRLEAEEAASAGRQRDALAIYADLAREGTATPDDYLAAARAFLAMGEPGAAAEWLSELLASSPYQREALGLLAEATMRSGETELAASAQRRLDLLAWGCRSSR